MQSYASGIIYQRKYNASHKTPTKITTTIYQGNHLYAKDNVRVGDVKVRDLRIREGYERGCIYVRVSIDEYGLIKTEYRQFDEEEYHIIPMTNSLILDEAEIEQKRKEAEATRETDELFREYVSIKAEIEDSIRQYKMNSTNFEKDRTIKLWNSRMASARPPSARKVTKELVEKWRTIREDIFVTADRENEGLYSVCF